jgi:tRNA modification GTPase
VDSVLVTLFHAPRSFTGEDVVEFSCHGGVLLMRRALEVLLEAGAHPAGPGEFSRRAFLNGKLDLTQAEAIMDLIGAQSDRALRAAHEQLEGRLGTETTRIRDDLLALLAHIEAYIDFPEEDITPDTGALLRSRLDAVLARMECLLGGARQGRLLREGVRTVLSGPPNAGKSSLLNRLLGFERAIVSAIPGTTRDIVEESILLRGWSLRLIDTAGLRETDDPLEKEGVLRARAQRRQADLLLHVEDASAPPADQFPEPYPDCLVLRVLNKTDLGEHPLRSRQEGVRISCANGSGMEALQNAIDALLETSAAEYTADSYSSFVAINARHQACLRRAGEQVRAAQNGMEAGLSPEFIAEELRGALAAVGDIVGRVDTEDLLGEIFSTFCIGK